MTVREKERSMPEACPVLTPEQREYGKIQSRIEEAMMRKVYAALQEATDEAQSEMASAGLDLPPPSRGYFAATMHQKLFCLLCDADPETFSGGQAKTALAIIRNSQNIARHYWGADI
jgi:hypothetical protein